MVFFIPAIIIGGSALSLAIQTFFESKRTDEVTAPTVTQIQTKKPFSISPILIMIIIFILVVVL